MSDLAALKQQRAVLLKAQGRNLRDAAYTSDLGRMAADNTAIADLDARIAVLKRQRPSVVEQTTEIRRQSDFVHRVHTAIVSNEELFANKCVDKQPTQELELALDESGKARVKITAALGENIEVASDQDLLDEFLTTEEGFAAAIMNMCPDEEPDAWYTNVTAANRRPLGEPVTTALVYHQIPSRAVVRPDLQRQTSLIVAAHEAVKTKAMALLYAVLDGEYELTASTINSAMDTLVATTLALLGSSLYLISFAGTVGLTNTIRGVYLTTLTKILVEDVTESTVIKIQAIAILAAQQLFKGVTRRQRSTLIDIVTSYTMACALHSSLMTPLANRIDRLAEALWPELTKGPPVSVKGALAKLYFAQEDVMLKAEAVKEALTSPMRESFLDYEPLPDDTPTAGVMDAGPLTLWPSHCPALAPRNDMTVYGSPTFLPTAMAAATKAAAAYSPLPRSLTAFDQMSQTFNTNPDGSALADAIAVAGTLVRNPYSIGTLAASLGPTQLAAGAASLFLALPKLAVVAKVTVGAAATGLGAAFYNPPLAIFGTTMISLAFSGEVTNQTIAAATDSAFSFMSTSTNRPDLLALSPEQRVAIARALIAHLDNVRR